MCNFFLYLTGKTRIFPYPQTSKQLLKRYLDPENIPKTASQGVFGCLEYIQKKALKHLGSNFLITKTQIFWERFLCKKSTPNHLQTCEQLKLKTHGGRVRYVTLTSTSPLPTGHMENAIHLYSYIHGGYFSGFLGKYRYGNAPCNLHVWYIYLT